MARVESKPVLIVGAGPAGLIAALSLAKLGIPVRIVEKLHAFHNSTRGTGTQPRSLEIYRFLGLLDDYLHAAQTMPPARAYKLPGGTEPLKTWMIVEPMSSTPDRPFLGEPRIVLGQYRLEGIFRDHLAKHGVQIEVATELMHFDQDDDGVTATLRKNGEELEEARVAYVIGADGARGVTRKLIGATFEGQTMEGDGGVWADVELEGLSPDYWHVWIQPAAIVLVRAIGDVGRFHVGIIGRHFDTTHLAEPDKFVDSIYEHTQRRDLKFKKFLAISYWKPQMRMVNKLRSGRAFLVGDVAHVHSPTGGQGLNTSIQDSFNLAWKLALVYKGLASSKLLESFEIERLPVIAQMLSATTALYKDVMTVQGQQSGAAQSVMTGFPQWHDTSLAQLDINYRWSPIVYDARGNGGLDDTALKARAYTGYPGEPVHAGDRAPDAPGLVDASGKESRLHDIFKPTIHTILIFSSDPGNAKKEIDSIVQAVRSLPEGTIQIVVLGSHDVPKPGDHDGVPTYKDAEGYAFRTYNIQDGKVTVVGVRPDGYVGTIVDDATGLQTYFSRIFRGF
ncbi:hypothetical protein PYCCODRAFT_1463192 [Trametes coccinea BRFM310]|uniref:Uncharacterized protein n=1 Tax=Trametes coccinea (strain BRFM310) TaxID=1353009 RepID=A0A1Y2J3D3_TRAC3|nr:hypothetical protein PYCCODRAFT_1463192 [Trametes coccinea BRFM310]